MYEPCLCGADDCSACFPGRAYRKHYALGSLDAEDIDILNEQAAADEEAEQVYQQMHDDARQRAEEWYAAEKAEAAYPDDMPPTVIEHDIF
jgi:hypothetical protein